MENLQEKSFATQPVELQASGTERADSFGELQVLLSIPCVHLAVGNEFGLGNSAFMRILAEGRVAV